MTTRPRHWELEPIPRPADPPLQVFTADEQRRMEIAERLQAKEETRRRDQQGRDWIAAMVEQGRRLLQRDGRAHDQQLDRDHERER